MTSVKQLQCVPLQLTDSSSRFYSFDLKLPFRYLSCSSQATSGLDEDWREDEIV